MGFFYQQEETDVVVPESNSKIASQPPPNHRHALPPNPFPRPPLLFLSITIHRSLHPPLRPPVLSHILLRPQDPPLQLPVHPVEVHRVSHEARSDALYLLRLKALYFSTETGLVQVLFMLRKPWRPSSFPCGSFLVPDHCTDVTGPPATHTAIGLHSECNTYFPKPIAQADPQSRLPHPPSCFFRHSGQ